MTARTYMRAKTRFTGFLRAYWRAVVALLLPVLAKVWCGYRIRGREHARQVRGRGVVVVANHVHPLDCITICGCLFRLRRTRFVTLTENLDIPVLGPLIRAYGGLPIAETASGTRRFVETVDGLLRGGAPCCFSPRSRCGAAIMACVPFKRARLHSPCVAAYPCFRCFSASSRAGFGEGSGLCLRSARRLSRTAWMQNSFAAGQTPILRRRLPPHTIQSRHSRRPPALLMYFPLRQAPVKRAQIFLPRRCPPRCCAGCLRGGELAPAHPLLAPMPAAARRTNARRRICARTALYRVRPVACAALRAPFHMPGAAAAPRMPVRIWTVRAFHRIFRKSSENRKPAFADSG